MAISSSRDVPVEQVEFFLARRRSSRIQLNENTTELEGSLPLRPPFAAHGQQPPWTQRRSSMSSSHSAS